jgi:cell division protein ZapB
MLSPKWRLLTPDTLALYISLMNDGATSKRLDLELVRIEKRVDELVEICNQLKDENRSLRQRQEMLVAEKASLLQKNDMVRGRVEAMIERLKSMEHSS